jgi:hypothetical protein
MILLERAVNRIENGPPRAAEQRYELAPFPLMEHR